MIACVVVTRAITCYAMQAATINTMEVNAGLNRTQSEAIQSSLRTHLAALRGLTVLSLMSLSSSPG